MKGSGSARNEGAGPLPYGYKGGTVTVTLRVQPAATRTEWAGTYGGQALRLRLAAPAVDDRANRACRRFLAETFAVAPGRVRIIRGARSRTKTVTIREVAPERWKAFRARWESA